MQSSEKKLSLSEISIPEPSTPQPPRRRSHSLQGLLGEVDIDFPGLKIPPHPRSVLGPLPEPVKEDLSDDVYVLRFL